MRVLTIGDEAPLVDYAKAIVTELRAPRGPRARSDFCNDHDQGEDRRAPRAERSTRCSSSAGATWKPANVSVRVHGKGNLGAKPNGEVVADILAKHQRTARKLEKTNDGHRSICRLGLDPARSHDDLMVLEQMVELGEQWWNSARNIYKSQSMDGRMAQRRERELNPAYEPHYTEDSLRKAAEALSKCKVWYFDCSIPPRSLRPFAFLTELETLWLHFANPDDVSPIAEMAALRSFKLGYLGASLYNKRCEDFRPLARCTGLRELTLAFNRHWPDLTGIETLMQLENAPAFRQSARDAARGGLPERAYGAALLHAAGRAQCGGPPAVPGLRSAHAQRRGAAGRDRENAAFAESDDHRAV